MKKNLHDFNRITGKFIDLREVNVKDAQFIIDLRTSEKGSRFLHKTEIDVSRQEAYLMNYLSKDDFKKMLLSFAVLVVLISAVDCIFLLMNGYKWYGELWQLGLFLFIPVICLYNGECGKKSFFNKWFFYAVYPLHLLIIWIFKVFIV